MESDLLNSLNSTLSSALSDTRPADVALGLTAAVALGGLAKWALSRGEESIGKKIPGPPGLPLLKNALDIPHEREWEAYDKWKRQYGPIYKLEVVGKQIIMLNTPEYINEIFVQRTAATANRPDLVMCNELCGFNATIVAYKDTPEYRQSRKYFRQTLGGKKNVETKCGEVIMEQTTKVMLRILENARQGGKALVGEIQQFISATTLGVSYAIDVKDKNDPYVIDAEKVLHAFSVTTTPGAYFVDALPILRYLPSWFPGAGFKRQAKIWKADLDRACTRPFEHVRKEIDANIVKKSFLHEHLSEPGVTPKAAELIKWSAISMYLGGSGTAVAQCHLFVLVMILNQEIQRKGREEIQQVLGSSRLPRFEDRDLLPYVNAIVKELFRWHPAVPLGGAHLLEEDVMMDGYFLKKGSIMFGNIWGVLHDEKYFSNPESFIPERYFEGSKETAELEVHDYVWGWGRRVCPGSDFAQAEVWLFVAQTLATFELLPPHDANGKEILLKKEIAPGSLSYPLPFDCRIRPINERAEALIRDSAAAYSS